MYAERSSYRNWRQGGQQTVEFAAAFCLLIVCIFLPLIDLGIIPIRYGLAAAAVTNTAEQLSRTERLSEAYALIEGDSGLRASLLKLGGVDPRSIRLSLAAVSDRDPGKTMSVDKPRSIPPEWLPGGGNCPCSYVLDLTAETDISPLVTVPFTGTNVPGLNAPMRFTLKGSSNWENLGRNPVTGEYFMNE